MSGNERILAAALAFKRHMEEDDAPNHGVSGGSRCGVEVGTFRGWFSGYSPRNGSFASVEGEWSDWVHLAKQIIAIDEAMKDPDLARKLADAKNENKGAADV